MSDSESGPVGAPLFSEFANDPDMAEVVSLFVSELPQRVRALREALEGERWADLTRLAHHLKGAGGGYGFPCITEAAAEVERLLRVHAEADLDSIRREVERLVDCCSRACA